jgi:hypothetical protein
MAKKNTPAAGKAPAKSPAPAAIVSTTPVRNTVVPPKAVTPMPAKKAKPTYEAIQLHAYYNWKTYGGSEFENWIKAERELGL